MFIFSYRTYLYLLIYWKYVGIYTCCLVFNIDANGNGANRTGQMGNATLPPSPCTVGLEGIAALCIQLNYHVAIGCANGAVANGNVWYRVHRTACSLHAALSSFFKMPHHEPMILSSRLRLRKRHRRKRQNASNILLLFCLFLSMIGLLFLASSRLYLSIENVNAIAAHGNI